MRTQRIGDVDVLRDVIEVPAMGALAINAFVIHAEEPVLVDTGRPVEREAFLAALGSVIDPAEIRWIWLTHPDRDHMGSLFDVLAMAPQAELVTTFFAAGYMSVEFPVPLDRIRLVNPGESLAVGGGKRLRAFRPPLFDSPMTVGLFDEQTGVCISSDCFGGVLPSLEDANVDDVGELEEAVLTTGQATWAVADSPWVLSVDRDKFRATYAELEAFDPSVVLSTHLPPAAGRFPSFLQLLERLPDESPGVPADHAFLQALLQEGAPAEREAVAAAP